MKRNQVTYYHVELPEHAVILAEGLPVETYLDTGDRTNFDGEGMIRLYPNFGAWSRPDAARLWETNGVALVVLTGARTRGGPESGPLDRGAIAAMANRARPAAAPGAPMIGRATTDARART